MHFQYILGLLKVHNKCLPPGTRSLEKWILFPGVRTILRVSCTPLCWGRNEGKQGKSDDKYRQGSSDWMSVYTLSCFHLDDLHLQLHNRPICVALIRQTRLFSAFISSHSTNKCSLEIKFYFLSAATCFVDLGGIVL